MSSDQQTVVTGANVRHSRGPRTNAGKAKSRANALRHGLAATVLAPGHLRADVEVLARAIAGPDADVSQLALARQIAAAQVDLLRVQAAKVALMNSQFGVASLAEEKAAKIGETFEEADPDVPALEPLDETTQTQDLVLVPSIEILTQLARLERYEQRAFARYRRAARGFMTYQAPHVSPKLRQHD